jgi:hypothetical protein
MLHNLQQCRPRHACCLGALVCTNSWLQIPRVDGPSPQRPVPVPVLVLVQALVLEPAPVQAPVALVQAPVQPSWSWPPHQTSRRGAAYAAPCSQRRSCASVAGTHACAQTVSVCTTEQVLLFRRCAHRPFGREPFGGARIDLSDENLSAVWHRPFGREPFGCARASTFRTRTFRMCVWTRTFRLCVERCAGVGCRRRRGAHIWLGIHRLLLVWR